MRKMAKVVVDNFIEIPRELIGSNLELIMCMEIMFINKQAFFTTLNKDIKFCGLVTLSNTENEECYRYLYVVMRH